MRPPLAVYLPAAMIEIIRRDCVARYPLEACGILIGRDDAEQRTITQAWPAANVWTDTAQRTQRFLIDPAAQLAAERDAAAAGLEVVGFYHSHPDAPPIPSPRDAEAAWPFYSYLIVHISAAGPGEAKCWVFDEPGRVFGPQALMIDR